MIAACDPTVTPAPDAGPALDVGASVGDGGWPDGGGTDAGSRDGGRDGGADAGAARTSWVEGDHAVLFVGNSYVFTNDVPGRYRRGAEAVGPLPVRIESVAPGGYRLAQHAVDADTDGSALARWLRTGTPEETAFDVVVLQEQSQIGGFPEGEPARVESLAGASRLAALARARDVDVVLYLTWGRERGDETNPGLFGTYAAMQDRLDAGYRAMAARLRAEGSRVRLAPVGAGFRAIHDGLVVAGEDPTAEGSAFDALYEGDGSHPSARGAYLAGAILLGAVTGVDPRGLPDAPDLDPVDARALREVAAEVLEDPAWEDELR
jgi:hypothetical protein